MQYNTAAIFSSKCRIYIEKLNNFDNSILSLPSYRFIRISDRMKVEIHQASTGLLPLPTVQSSCCLNKLFLKICSNVESWKWTKIFKLWNWLAGYNVHLLPQKQLKARKETLFLTNTIGNERLSKQLNEQSCSRGGIFRCWEISICLGFGIN